MSIKISKQLTIIFLYKLSIFSVQSNASEQPWYSRFANPFESVKKAYAEWQKKDEAEQEEVRKKELTRQQAVRIRQETRQDKGILKESIYPIFMCIPEKREFELGSAEGAFSFSANDQMYDMVIVPSQEGGMDNLFVRVGRPTESEIVNSNTGQTRKTPSQESAVYKITLPDKKGENNFSLAVENHSNKGRFLAYDSENCAGKTPNAFMSSPLAIATNGKSVFFKPEPGADDLFEYTYGQCGNQGKSKWILKKHTRLGFQQMTTSRLRAIVGDTRYGRIFFGSEAPNLYYLDPGAYVFKADKIVEDGYVLEATEGTLIYGRVFGLETTFEKVVRKVTGFFKSAVRKFTGSTEGSSADAEKMFRIGYYAKFFGNNSPTVINYSEDNLDECKMLSALETVIFGDLMKYYDMVPAAASKDFAVAFLGRARGMHFALQSAKGRLFPTLLSWYKLIKWQLYPTGSFAQSGKGEAWDPDVVIPRRLYMIRPRNERETHLLIVTGKDIFLMYTPLENISNNGNENYNVVMNKIFSAPEGHVISTTTLYDDFQNTNGQKLYVITQDINRTPIQESFNLRIFSDFATCIDEIETSVNGQSNYSKAKKRWNWIEQAERRGMRTTNQ